MKQEIASLLAGILMVFLYASSVRAAAIEPLGRIEVFGGAEKEDKASDNVGSLLGGVDTNSVSAGARGGIEALGVLPLTERFGVQAIAHYVGGGGNRFGLSSGPLYSWDSGKAGFFVAYQHRSHNDNNFVHLRSSVAFYLQQASINIFYSHPVSSPQRDGSVTEYGINHLQGALSYFTPADLASFMRKDNVELTLGVQANSFAGAGRDRLQTGVGPVFGFSSMPAQAIEVNLVQGTFDHQGRYRIGAGVSFNFTKDAPTLKEIRRRYLQPNFFAPTPSPVLGAHGRARLHTTSVFAALDLRKFAVAELSCANHLFRPDRCSASIQSESVRRGDRFLSLMRMDDLREDFQAID